ncbi:autotransporter domain-containing protein [Devosia sp. BK]|uniref:autotransporter outer membrane beta-barrel domain-containing protein n=1 Tax=Devosia sp. BK TaxID=2871706 RepID=UPI00293A639F|nr:autotransporter domain-containing protein [Devosia sp. BK]MDV3253056.1 autotransporter domain-containing protein [Devosia sp. BK]
MARLRRHREDYPTRRVFGWSAALLCGTAPLLAQPAFAQSAAPFQMLSSDLQKYANGAPVPGPFQVNATDVQAATNFSSGATASGTLTQNTGETVIFTGTGSAGNAVVINNDGGATRFYDNSTAASANITNNGTLQFSNTASGGQAQIVTNGGAVTVLTDTAVAGAAGATLTNNGTTIFLDQSGTGGSAVVNNQTGELHLAGNSTIGGAFDNSGLVVAGGAANLGTGLVVNNATGNMLLRETASAGSATLANSGTLVFTGNSTANAATINNNQTGIAAFLGASNAGTGSQLTNDGRLYFGENASAGQSIIRTQAGGQTIFYGSASGGTAALRVANGGVLDISLLDTAGLSIGALTSDVGSVVALGSKTLTVGSTNQQPMVVSGLQDGGLGGGTGGSLTKVGTSELELTGTNSYAGLTRVESGRLKAASAGAFAPLSGVVLAAGSELDIGAWDQTIGSLAGAGSVILGNVPNRLTIGTNNQSTEFSGDFQADGGIIKVGTGTLTLSGTSTNTGDSRVEAGTLRVNGSFAQSPLTVAGGTLAGSGAVGDTHVLAGGTINPGSGSNLTIASDLLLDAGAVYRVDITGTGSDSLTVGNTATIGGATLALGDFTTPDPTGSYVILSAATITGSFVFDPYDYAFLLPELNQGATAITLTIARNGLRFSNIALTPNQRAAATALEGFAPADPVFGALLTANATDARRFYELAAGEAHAVASTVSQRSFGLFADSLKPSRRASLNGIVEHRSAGTAVGTALDVGVDTPTVTQTGWVAPLGGIGTIANDGNGGAVNWTSGGLAAGYEIASETGNGHTVVGFGLGTIATSATIDQRLSSIAGQGYYAGLYGQWREGPVWLDGQLAYGANHIETSRSLEIGGLTRTATADYWTQALGAGLEARYEFELAHNLFVGPVASLDVGWTGHGGASETGAGTLNQTIAPSDQWKVDAGIGVAARYDMPLDNGANLSVVGKALWQHSFVDGANAQTVSLAGGGGPFVVTGASPGQDRLRLVAGVEYQPSPDVIVSLDYAATLGGSEMSHAARLALRVKF